MQPLQETAFNPCSPLYLQLLRVKFTKASKLAFQAMVINKGGQFERNYQVKEQSLFYKLRSTGSLHSL